MTLEIVSSNRLEELGDCFVDRISSEPLPPMAVEQVLVQSRGMARWLNLRLAVGNTIAAGIKYLFPNNFIDHLLQALMPEGAEPLLTRRDLAWQLAAVLDSPDLDPEVVEYVRASNLHRLQLAFTLADRFDQYTVYRHDMIAAWEAGEGGHWQARLWRRLRGEDVLAAHRPHRGDMLARLRGLAADPAALAGHLPPRLAIFGVSSLPPFHIEVLALLAAHCRVTFYLLNPCRQMLDDIASRRQVSRLTEGLSRDPAELYLEGHNPLLSSLGGQGAELFRLLRDYDAIEKELFSPPDLPDSGVDPLLVLQRDILDDDPDLEPVTVAPGQLRHSITFHDCSSRMREVEVLREELLAIFSENPDLGAADVAVMVPDIGAYAPLIDAVFGDGRDPEIPYAIADRPLLNDHGLPAAFMELLCLGRERFRLSAVISLLEKEPVRRRFLLSEKDVVRISAWFDEAGVRWGLDAADRENLGLPPTPWNTWRSGIDRLFMGYATGSDPGCGTVCGIAPLMQLGNEEAELAGRAVTAIETIFGVCRELAAATDLAGWSLRLARAVNLCLDPGTEEEEALNTLQELIASLADDARRCGFSGELTLDEIIGFLVREMGRERRSGGFLSGRVTFCELLPMRSIPFEVICLLGMGYEAFPRRDRFGSLDLMASNPRPGDRSRRQDDRYLFLEVLISARRRLYLSFIGRDCSSNTERPPSVLVSELVDYLDRRFVIGDGIRASALLSRRYPVASWSRLDFSPGSPRSFSGEDLECAMELGKNLAPATVFSSGPVGGSTHGDEISLDRLVDFFVNPARYFCRNVLNLTLPGAEAGHDDLEPFVIDGLAGHDLDRRILAILSQGLSPDGCLERARSEGILPHGPRGEWLFAARVAVLARLDRERQMLAPGDSRMVPVEIEVNGTVIRGEVCAFADNRVMLIRRGSLRGRDYLTLWINLLALGATTGGADGFLIGGGKGETETVGLSLPQDPVARLAELVGIFHRSADRVIPFFPDSAMVLAEYEARGKSPDYALGKAVNKYRSSGIGWGEGDDRWVQFCFQEDLPLDREFVRMARLVFKPLLEGLKTGGG